VGVPAIVKRRQSAEQSNNDCLQGLQS
jgi:hypothetical protein